MATPSRQGQSKDDVAPQELHFDLLLVNLEEGQAVTGLQDLDRVTTALGKPAPVAVVTPDGDGCVVAAPGRGERVVGAAGVASGGVGASGWPGRGGETVGPDWWAAVGMAQWGGASGQAAPVPV